MYKCPKCHSTIDGNKLKCNNCNFILKISLNEYEQREKKLYDYDEIKYENKSRNIKNLIKYLESNAYEEEIINFNVPKEEFDVLIYKLISYIYLDYFIPRKDFENNIKDLLNGYCDEFKNNSQTLILILNNLKTLLGFPEFNKNYEELLQKDNLSLNKGMEIYGFLIDDILENNLQIEDFDSKLKEYVSEYKLNENFHLTRKDKKIQKKLKEYYKITGKYYFSKRFDHLLDKFNLSVNQAFNIKKKLLIDIYSENRIYIKKNFEEYLHYEIANKDKPLIYRRLGAGTIEDRGDLENLEDFDMPYQIRMKKLLK